MRRSLVLLLWFAVAFASADTTYLGLFIQGKRIGYSASSETRASLDGTERRRLDNKTLIDSSLLGADLKTVIESKTWFGEQDKALRMEFFMESGGRTQKTIARFEAEAISIEVDNNGALTKKRIPLPKDAPVVDDAVNALLADPAAGSKAFYVLDPMTVSLVKNTVRRVGEQEVTVNGQSTKAQVIEVTEPRGTMRLFMSGKGDVIKIDGPMGIEMRPISEEEALGSAKPVDGPDLATANAIKLDKSVGDTKTIRSLKLRIQGADLQRLPSDAFQTVRREGAAWIVTIHPIGIDPKTTIATAAKAKNAWTLPSMNIPSDTETFKKLARQVIGNAKTVAEAAKRARDYVFQIMHPNAGIGVLRDAAEVLRTKEGVCRDYAVLTATLLRAARVPSRLTSGLVMMEGSYYYHAWVEVWDGTNWAGVDATRPAPKVGATHLKLAQGNVEDAFVFTFLDKVKVEVLHVGRG